MNKCKYFKIYELVDKQTYEKYGQAAWQFFDVKALKTLDLLRHTFGSATVNSWKWGGIYKDSGLRAHHSKTGSKYSQHRFGRAFDVKFKNQTAKEVRAFIRADQEFWSEHISGIENKVSWFHFDTRNSEGIKWFNP